MSRKLYVGNLPYQISEAEIRGLFEPFGAIDSVHLVVDKMTGRRAKKRMPSATLAQDVGSTARCCAAGLTATRHAISTRLDAASSR